jgi:hypothetical protein
LTITGINLFSSWEQFLLPNPILILVVLCVILFDVFQLRGKREEFILDWPRAALIIFVVALLILAVLAGFSDQIAPFVYQSF